MILSGQILAFIEGIGGPELMMIMFIVLLLFGANKLPELARGLGKSMREFKKAAAGVEDEIRKAMEEPPTPAPLPPPPPAASETTSTYTDYENPPYPDPDVPPSTEAESAPPADTGVPPPDDTSVSAPTAEEALAQPDPTNQTSSEPTAVTPT